MKIIFTLAALIAREGLPYNLKSIIVSISLLFQGFFGKSEQMVWQPCIILADVRQKDDARNPLPRPDEAKTGQPQAKGVNYERIKFF